MSKKWILSLVFFASGVVRAQDNGEIATHAGPQDLTEVTSQMSEVTDIQLRAEEGSLSRFSLKTGVEYLGSDMSNTAGQNQPDPDHLIGNYSSKLKGKLAGQYRLDSHDALDFGIGMSASHPTQNMNNTDSSNPYMTYSRALRIGDLQFEHSPGVTYYTSNAYMAVAQTASLTDSLNLVYNVNESRYSLSMDIGGEYNFFSRNYIAPKNGKPYTNDSTAQQYDFSYAPGVKYSISDRLNTYARISFAVGNPRADIDGFAIPNETPKADIGLGFLFTHDVYVAPYIITYPSIMSPSTTSLNVQTIVSIL